MAEKYIERIKGDFQLLPVKEYFFDLNGKQYTKNREGYVKPSDLTYKSLDDVDYSYWDGTGEKPENYGHYRVVAVNNGDYGVAYYRVPIYSSDIRYKPLEPVVEEPVVLHVDLTSKPAKPKKKKIPEIVIRDPRVRKVGGDGTAEVNIPGDVIDITKIIQEIYKTLNPPTNPPGTYDEYEAPPEEKPKISKVTEEPVQQPTLPLKKPGFLKRLLGIGEEQKGTPVLKQRPETRRMYAYRVKDVHRYHIPVEILDQVLAKVDELKSKSDDYGHYLLTYLPLLNINIGDTVEDVTDHYISKTGFTIDNYHFANTTAPFKNISYADVYTRPGLYDNGYATVYYDDSDRSESELCFGKNDWMRNVAKMLMENYNWEGFLTELEILNEIKDAFDHPDDYSYGLSYPVNYLRQNGYTDALIKSIIYNTLKGEPIRWIHTGLTDETGNQIWNYTANVHKFGGKINYFDLF